MEAPAPPSIAGRNVFARVVASVDGSQQALEAARQAALLLAVDGRLTLLAVWNAVPLIGGTGTRVPAYADPEVQRRRGEEALLAASEYVAPYAAPVAKLVRGVPIDELLADVNRDEDTLVAVGSSGVGRLRGIVEGSVATEIVHRSPCSVLVARAARDGFPHRIVVGIDGSAESAAAYAAALYLGRRFETSPTAIVAWGGDGADPPRVAAITGEHHRDSRRAPAEALVAASKEADLVVVGSRGLHGVRALGSVSEQVAHEAACSVLVVREPVWQRLATELGRSVLATT